MDWSILLGVLGIIVSIAVGWWTFRLANKRAFGQRYLTAKATVLQSLSKSLGEDAVPSADILRATIRSVLREIGDPRLTLDVDDILDDLVRQVTSDPFLDSERRIKLQSDIQRARHDAHKEHGAALPETNYEPIAKLNSSISSLVLGLLGTIGSFLAVASFLPLAGKSNDVAFSEYLRSNFPKYSLFIAIALTIVAMLITFDNRFFARLQQVLRKLFSR